MENNKLLILCVAIIVSVLIISTTIFFVTGSNVYSNPFAQEDQTDSSGDLKLNTQGYDYKLVSNKSETIMGILCLIETYTVTGQGDTFTLTINIVPGTVDENTLKQINETFIKSPNFVTTSKELNGKYYFIQTSGADKGHNTTSFADSLVSENTASTNSGSNTNASSTTTNNTVANNTTSSEPNILSSGDVELNLTGYEFQESSNTPSSDGGYSETYSVTGQGDSFTITITAIPETVDSSTTTGGDVSSSFYLNGMHYIIEITGGNSQHHSQSFLDSILLTQGSSSPSTQSTDTTTNSVDDSEMVEDPYSDYSGEGLEGEPMEDSEYYQ